MRPAASAIIPKTEILRKQLKVYFSMLRLGGDDGSPLAPFDGGLKKNRTNLVFSTFFINILSLALPIMTLQVYDRILANSSMGTLRVLVMGVCMAVIVEVVLRIGRAYLTNWTGAVYEHAVTCAAMKRMVEADFRSTSKKSVGEHLQYFSSLSKLRDFFGGQAMVTLIDLPFAMLFLLLIAYLAGFLVLVPMALLVVFSYVAWRTGHSLKESLIERDKFDDRRFDFIIETLGSIHSIKSMGLEAAFVRRYERLQSECGAVNYAVANCSGNAFSFGGLFSQIMTAAVVTVGAPMVMHNYISMGTLIAVIILSGRLMQPMQRALGLWTRFQDVQLAEEKANYLLTLPALAKHDEFFHGERSGALEIKDLVFRYDDDRPVIFGDINLSLKPGDAISISGDHGEGKTTFLELIAGMYAPSGGTVKIDGAETCDYPAAELVSHVGYLATEGTIFRGTIFENLTAFNPLKEARAMELATLLSIDETISKLPMGYETMLEGGPADPIPPGLKQRIAIARVLLEKPRVILFDNADRALDTDGYNFVFRLLAQLKGRATMIISSDDRNMLRLAERHYVLKGGQLHERAGDAQESYELLPYQELGL